MCLNTSHQATSFPSFKHIETRQQIMAKPSLLLISLYSLCLLQALLFHACLARQTEQFQLRDECQLSRLEAREPDSRVECEGGIIESWNPNHEQFQCTGINLIRTTMESNGLHLPSYTNAPQLVHIVQGRGTIGMVFPGCPETFEESQEGRSRQSQQDRHQKIQHVREGDVIAIPAGVAYWSYNDGNQRLVSVTLLDVSNHNNQLDRSPRRFYLAGTPHDEFHQSRREEQYLSGEKGRPRYSEEQQERGMATKKNIFGGFNPNILEEAFNIDAETARRMQNPSDGRGSIIKVRERLQLVRPGRSREEQEHEMRQQELRQSEQEHARRSGRSGSYSSYGGNGVEETMCTLRIKENIGDPARADVFSPQAGRISTVNSYNLPILSWLQLSAERGFLYSNAMYAPHWNINAHSVIYGIRGRARCQVVDSMGRSVFEGELRQGQALTVPQNFAIVKKADKEGFEWISFKTNDRAKVNQLAGKVSFMRALPEDVIANSYRISREQARRLKYNREETTLFRTTGTSERMAIVA